MSHVRPFAILLILGASGTAVAQSASVGLSSVRARMFVNESLAFNLPEEGESFGSAFAVGDFDGDGADDLATGIPHDHGLAVEPCLRCGAVVVRYGIVGRGLDTDPVSTVLSQQAAGSPSSAHPDEAFGTALAAGDFNGDGVDDLAIGVPREVLEGQVESPGGVAIHYGLPGGIQPVAEHFLVPGVGDVPGVTEDESRFGLAVAAGDFDGDGFDDLAIGAPLADVGTVEDAGTVTVLHGGDGGLSPVFGFLIHQDADGAPDVAEEGDLFGLALATGDFNGFSFDDLAIGVPGEDLRLGAFLTLFGSDFGLLYNGHRWLGQGGIGPAGGPGEPDDFFARVLASGDFDGDGLDDLAIGSPGEDLDGAVECGQVHVVYGDAVSRFDLERTQAFDQGFEGNETGDHFGFALSAGDFDGDGRADLAVGHPQESSGAGPGSGAATVLMGSETLGLCCRRRTIFPGNDGFPGDPFQDGPRVFGSDLATGDFDADGHADLAIGAPGEAVSGVQVGAETVIHGSRFSDGFDGGDTTYWSGATP